MCGIVLSQFCSKTLLLRTSYPGPIVAPAGTEDQSHQASWRTACVCARRCIPSAARDDWSKERARDKNLPTYFIIRAPEDFSTATARGLRANREKGRRRSRTRPVTCRVHVRRYILLLRKKRTLAARERLKQHPTRKWRENVETPRAESSRTPDSWRTRGYALYSFTRALRKATPLTISPRRAFPALKKHPATGLA